MKKSIEWHELQSAHPYLMKEKNRGNPLSCPVTSFVYDLVEERRNIKKTRTWQERWVPPSIFNESQANQGDPLSKAQRWRNSGTHPKYLGERLQRSKSKNSNLNFIEVLKPKVHKQAQKLVQVDALEILCNIL